MLATSERFLKKQRLETLFPKRAAVRPQWGWSTPRGAFLTLSCAKSAAVRPLGARPAALFTHWGLTDRQVSLPPFRALPRSGGAGFRQLLFRTLPRPEPEPSPWVAQDFSWGAGFRQLLLRTLPRPGPELPSWVTRVFFFRFFPAFR